MTNFGYIIIQYYHYTKNKHIVLNIRCVIYGNIIFDQLTNMVNIKEYFNNSCRTITNPFFTLIFFYFIIYLPGDMFCTLTSCIFIKTSKGFHLVVINNRIDLIIGPVHHVHQIFVNRKKTHIYLT